MQYGIFVVIFLSFFAYWETDALWPPWCLLAMTAAFFSLEMLFLVKRSADKYLPLATLFLWVSFNSLVVLEFKPALTAPGIELSQIITIKNLCSTVYIEFLLFSFALTLGWKTLRAPLALGFYIMGLLHAVVLIVDQCVLHLETGTQMIGLLGNRSIGASFTAVWIFYTLYFAEITVDRKQWPPLERRLIQGSSLVGVLAVLVSSSGISYGALLVGAAAFLYRKFKFSWAWFPAIIGPGLLLGQLVKPQWKSYLFLPGAPPVNGSRYQAWPLFLHFWHDTFPWWLGSGFGTFKLWGPTTQLWYHWQEGKFWLWAHNDWLQILFELGVPGLILALVLAFQLLRRTWNAPSIFAALVALGVVMLGNYPLHLAPFCLFIWFLVFEGVEECGSETGG